MNESFGQSYSFIRDINKLIVVFFDPSLTLIKASFTIFTPRLRYNGIKLSPKYYLNLLQKRHNCYCYNYVIVD